MQRDQTLDTIRGVAIVFVVCAHAVMAFHGFDFTPQAFLGGVHNTMPWGLESLVVDLNYGVALPLFGFVTGLTLFYTRHRGWGLIRARAQSLLVPYASWLALGTVLVGVRSGIAAVPGNIVRGTITAGASSSLWFLYALFVCVCAFVCCRSDRALVIAACLAPVVMAALSWAPIDLLEVRDAAWLFAPLVAGYLIAKHRPRLFPLPLGVCSVVAVVALPLVAIVSPGPLAFASLPAVPAELAYALVRVAGGVAGCIVVYALMRPLAPLGWLGRRTLGIYAMHPLLVQAARAAGVSSLWLAALLALLVSAAITLALEQVPLSRMLLLGQPAKRKPVSEIVSPTGS